MVHFTIELADFVNIPRDITPKRGPPNKPKIDKDICRTCAPAY